MKDAILHVTFASKLNLYIVTSYKTVININPHL